MRKFAVLLHGTCRVRVVDWEAHSDLATLEKVSFHTTRFVSAQSVREAAKLAREMVLTELGPPSLNHSGDDDIIVAEVRENPEDFDQRAPGRGFTWYTDSIDEEIDRVKKSKERS